MRTRASDLPRLRRAAAALGIALSSLALAILAGCAQSPLAPTAATGNAARTAVDLPPDIPRLTGVNWFGFETGNFVPHGLWSRDYQSMLIQMRDLGFNCVRLPYSDAMLDKTPTNGIQINAWGTDPYTKTKGINVDLAGLSSLQIMDKIIDKAGTLGLRIILDNHSREADGYYNQTLWYTKDVSEAQWIDHWKQMVLRYKDRPQVVAVDLSNEPHGGYQVPGMSPAATWGFNLPGLVTDWKAAAERCAAAIQPLNPSLIIVVQGVQDYEGSNYWWGSNHAGYRVSPITSIPKNRLMLSVHEYGPEVHSQDWFTDPAFPTNLPAVWRDRFWFIKEQNLAGLYIGEIGITEKSAADPSSIPYQWLTAFLKFAGKQVHFTWWAWNPNSGDTGGILQDDWLTVNPAKYNLIKPYLEPAGPQPTPTPSPDPGPLPAGLTIDYQPASDATVGNTIGLKFRLRNTGTAAVPLSEVGLGWWFTADGLTGLSATVDYAGAMIAGSYRELTGSAAASLAAMPAPKPGADTVLRISFAVVGSLAPGDSAECQLRLTNAAWQDFNLADDWSRQAGAGIWSANPHLQLTIAGQVAGGVAP